MASPDLDLSRLTRAEKLELIELYEEKQLRISRKLFYALYPEVDTPWAGATNKDFDHGAIIYARQKYPKHLEFFSVGKDYPERCFMAANRVSKTLGGGGYEATCHLTGEYPDWWDGYRFDHPTHGWAVGDTSKTVREILQATMLGDVVDSRPRKTVSGTGLLPGHLIGVPSWNSHGVPDSVDVVPVKHTSGGWSTIGFKSYEQGRKAFQGTAKHWIWMDEEPPSDIYDECLMRTATTNGRLILTFTPLEGLSEVVLSFLPAEQRPGAAT